MSITVQWQNSEQTLLLYRFQGKWTWSDLYPVYHQAIAMETAVTHRVDVIVDIRDSAVPPPNVLLNMKYFADHQPPNIGVAIIVSPSPLIRALYDLCVRFYEPIGERFSVALTMDDALARLADLGRASTT